MNIAIYGVGGVGGYIGAKLANIKSENSIYFIARGEHLNTIKRDGITLTTKNQKINSRALECSDTLKTFPKMDVIICSIKSYGIDQFIDDSRNALKNDGVIIPLLNGVDSFERLVAEFGNERVAAGCAFIVSYIKSPGIIEETTKKNYFYFGDKTGDNPKLKLLESILIKSDINVTYKSNIERYIWNKFEYISPIATITTALNITCDQAVKNETYKSILFDLYQEFENVALAKGVIFDAPQAEKIFSSVVAMPDGVTTSMQRDFQTKGICEVSSLTHYIIKEGKQLNVPTPTYERMYNTIIG